MSCCRHPLSVALLRAGYPRFAERVDQITQDDESPAFRDKQVAVQEIIMEELEVPSPAVDHLTLQVFELLGKGFPHMHEWPWAEKALLHSFTNLEGMSKVPNLPKEIDKLRDHWSTIQNIVWK